MRSPPQADEAAPNTEVALRLCWYQVLPGDRERLAPGQGLEGRVRRRAGGLRYRQGPPPPPLPLRNQRDGMQVGKTGLPHLFSSAGGFRRRRWNLFFFFFWVQKRSQLSPPKNVWQGWGRAGGDLESLCPKGLGMEPFAAEGTVFGGPAKEMMQPRLIHLRSHLFGCADVRA